MNGTVKIKGGKRLCGEVEPIPNKNSFMAALPAALLTSEDVIYKNVPGTSDVGRFLEIYEDLGASVKRRGGDVVINCKNVKKSYVEARVAKEFRSSFMFAGPMLARFGRARVPMPGGCLLGTRSVAAHVDAFSKLGVKVAYKNGYYDFVLGKSLPKKVKIWQLEASVTGTENLILLAAGLDMELEIIDAASEPHVTDLLKMLGKMGVRVEGMGSNRLKIGGRKKMAGAVFEAVPDYIDIAGLMTAVGITNGEVLIKGANRDEVVGGLRRWFGLFGLEFEEEGKDLLVKVSKRGLRVKTDTGFPMAGEKLPKLRPRPWPGFPVDALPVITTLACKAYGRVLMHNWMYENGFDFVRELNRLGANIFMADPQRVIVPKGRVKFKGGEVAPPPVIQGTKAVFLASLADKVETVVHGVDVLKRRYPNVVETYKSLGADIEWV